MRKHSTITRLVLIIPLLFTMFGCGIQKIKGLVEDVKTLTQLGLTQVESAVIPVEKGEGETPDLLVFNRMLDPPPVKCFFSYLFKTEDGWQVRWEHNLGSDVIGYSDVTALVDQDRAYLIVGSTAQASSLSDGTVEWETALSDEVAATCRECAVLAQDRLVVLTSDLVLQGVDIDSGAVAWSYELNTSLDWQISPLVLGGGTKIAIVDQTDSDSAAPGGLYVFDAADGEPLASIVPECDGIPFRVGMLPVFVDREGKRATFGLSLGLKHCVQGWDIDSGDLLWESMLPKEIINGPSFFNNPHLDNPGLLAEDVLYYGFGGPAKVGKLVTVDLADGAVHQLLEDARYALRPLYRDGGLLVVQAIRTKGSEQHELWGVDISSGATLWQYELQGTDLMGWGSESFGAATWTLAPAENGLAVIQIISENDERILDSTDEGMLHYAVVDILDSQDGTVVVQNKGLIDDDHWMGMALTQGRAYLSIRNLYSVDLGTGEVGWEWPMTEPPLDLVDPLAE